MMLLDEIYYFHSILVLGCGSAPLSLILDAWKMCLAKLMACFFLNFFLMITSLSEASTEKDEENVIVVHPN